MERISGAVHCTRQGRGEGCVDLRFGLVGLEHLRRQKLQCDHRPSQAQSRPQHTPVATDVGEVQPLRLGT